MPVAGTIARGDMTLQYPYKNDSVGYANSKNVTNLLRRHWMKNKKQKQPAFTQGTAESVMVKSSMAMARCIKVAKVPSRLNRLHWWVIPSIRR